MKLDLALRAIADAEGLDCSDDDLVAEIERVAERLDTDADAVRAQLERNGQIPAVRSDLRKQKAYDWLSERVTINDEDGNPIARELLEIEQPSDEADAGGDPAPDSDTPASDTESDSTKEDA